MCTIGDSSLGCANLCDKLPNRPVAGADRWPSCAPPPPRQSGAKINITDGSCPERIVTVTGTTDAIFKGFQLITKKLEEVIERNQNEYGVSADADPLAFLPCLSGVPLHLFVVS